MSQSSLLKQIESYLPELLQLLEESVNMDSPSRNKAQCDLTADWYAAQFTRLIGGRVERIPHPIAGDRLLCVAGSGAKQILLVGHYDTVWPSGEAQRRPFRIEDGAAFGPGVYDMKAGLLQAIFALKALQDTGRFPEDKRVVLLINSDEEIGSPTSREFIETAARQSAGAFVLEPPMEPRGALKTARKGSGRYKLTVKGVSAHAGVNPEQGISAIQELACQIQLLHKLTDYNLGTTVNVGLIHGGIGSNVVPDHAEAEIDVRIATLDEAERIEAEFAALTPSLPGAEIVVTGGMMRPPMERTDAIASLYSLARGLAKDEFGLALEETATGGVSDGNFTAAAGTPTLDGLGARGDFAHSPREYVRIDEIPVRTALLARLIEAI
ncbi:M20/M25/M40 family metallo-hydrolase [Paenibacillus sp. LMG 31456]|uniref:M20/M25/M40 family metallo-hydrolase n=1 Tax=Paenibacillus foliorum TaxID=2654974 RepID=A0A972GZV9_9BACL|nr:M20 family metallopeptidase [Paenibacillus foliorum]NOU96857.1 M20/M25/M40 family metallo-hydrolase [Paenibacillus foliorum]